MAKYKPQHSRLLFIDRKISEGRYPNCSSLAEEWEVSSKTIQPNIEGSITPKRISSCQHCQWKRVICLECISLRNSWSSMRGHPYTTAFVLFLKRRPKQVWITSINEPHLTTLFEPVSFDLFGSIVKTWFSFLWVYLHQFGLYGFNPLLLMFWDFSTRREETLLLEKVHI